MEITQSDLENKLRVAYKSNKGSFRRIKWPSEIFVDETKGIITLKMHLTSISKNMQDNGNAFEGWILALKELVYPNHKFTIEFDRPNPPNDPHYQRFLTRLWMFDSLFGTSSKNPWFELSKTASSALAKDCDYLNPHIKLKCNTGKNSRARTAPYPYTGVFEKMSESELEYRLCKNGTDKNCLPDTMSTSEVFRQFPMGIFKNQVSANIKNKLFPRNKACIDLVAEGKDSNTFWIFELKKYGNNPLGILSELLFYTTIVLDIVHGYITPEGAIESDCYDPKKLAGKTVINACFLAPEFHPLLLDKIIDRLNDAFVNLSPKNNSHKKCSVIFHKYGLCMPSGTLKAVNLMGTVTELDSLFEKMRKTGITVHDYEEKTRSGEIATRGIMEDDLKFKAKYPDHPMTSTNRNTRMSAADKLFELLVINKTPATADQLFQLHEALFDCCASVRLVVSQILGNIGNATSITALNKLVKEEKDSSSVTQSACEAVKVLKGELKVNDGKYIRNEIVY